MNPDADRYSRFALVREMCQTADVIREFDADQAAGAAREIAAARRLLLTGEGSSRIFPAKSAIAHARRRGWPLTLHTESALQAGEYDLREWAVFAASNSGKTSEAIELFIRLLEQGHDRLFGLTANQDTKLQELAAETFVLSCGKEEAVAATKSVVEQALFYRALLEHAASEPRLTARRGLLADDFRQALAAEVDDEIVSRLAAAPTIYWAGRNDGVAEELTLKTNEIARKRADFLEGTYAVHGVEEIMQAGDAVVWLDPYERQEQKFEQELAEKIGVTIVAVAARPTRFRTMRIPDAGDLAPFVQMAAGWSLLVETGIRLGVNLDEPRRARKVGNEFIST